MSPFLFVIGLVALVVYHSIGIGLVALLDRMAFSGVFFALGWSLGNSSITSVGFMRRLLVNKNKHQIGH